MQKNQGEEFFQCLFNISIQENSRHWGQPLWIHWEVCQYWGLMAMCCESTGTKSIAARFFPSQYTWQNYLQVAYLNLARSQLFQDPIEQKSSPVSWGRSQLKLYRLDDLSDRVCNTCSSLPLFQCVWLVTVFQWQCFYGLCLEFTLSWHSLPHNCDEQEKENNTSYLATKAVTKTTLLETFI